MAGQSMLPSLWGLLVLASPLNILGGAAAALALFLLAKAIHAFRSPLQKLPGSRCHNLLVGDLPYVMSHPTGFIMKKWNREYGKTHRANSGLFFPPAVITSDLVAIAHIQQNPDLFIKPPRQSRTLRQLVGDGVLMAEFHDHRRQRRILNPAFSAIAVRDIVPVMYNKAAELRDRISAVIDEDSKHDASPTAPQPEDIVPGARKIDMGRYLTEVAFDIIGVAGFDYDFNCQQTPNPIVQGFRKSLWGLMKIDTMAIAQHVWNFLDIIPTRRLQRVHASFRRTTAIGEQLIAQKRRELSVDKSTNAAKDILSLIVKANMAHDLPESQRLSDKEISYQVSTFLFAGSETTSNALSWMLYRLSQHQDIQDRLRADLDALGATEPSLDQLDKVPLLENVIRETLRLDAPVPELLRETTQDTVLPLSEPVTCTDGTVCTSLPLEKGILIVEPLEVVHINKEIWGDDAEQFNPDRFDRTPAVKVSGVYGNLLAFNGGARNCIGYRFALAEMKVVLFMLLQNFKFEILPSKPEITRKNFIVMLPWVVGEEHAGAQMPLLVSNLK